MEDNYSKVTEKICIDTKRIFDSCMSKDCLEDLRVTFNVRSQKLIDCAFLVKCRECELVTAVIDLEETPFNRGFYSVDVTYYFKLKFDTYKCANATPEVAIGFASFSKKCILFGGEGNVKIFTSQFAYREMDEQCTPQFTNPNAKVQVCEPVVLATDVVDCCSCHVPCCGCFPKTVTSCGCDDLVTSGAERAVLVTLGLFTIIQIERDVQVMIPSCDYCIPTNECSCSDNDNPCDAFSKIAFPIDEFFPADNKKCSPCSKQC